MAKQKLKLTSPILFNLLMNEIIEEVELEETGYWIANKFLKILGDADEAALFPEIEKDLQRLLFRLKRTAERWLWIGILYNIYKYIYIAMSIVSQYFYL